MIKKKLKNTYYLSLIKLDYNIDALIDYYGHQIFMNNNICKNELVLVQKYKEFFPKYYNLNHETIC